MTYSCVSNAQAEEIKIWPEIEPNETGYLKVTELHSISYEQSGNPKSKPVFIVYGGPVGGCNPVMKRFFKPEVFRITFFDQSVASISKPFAEIQDNTSQGLVEDMEKIRSHLGLKKI